MPSKIIRVFGDKCPPSLALNHGHFCSSRNCTGLIFYKLGDISPVTQSFLNEYRTQDSEREREKYSIREVCIIIFFDTEYTFKLGKEKSVEYIKT